MKSMIRFRRFALTIGVTAALTIAAAIALFGTPADAQPSGVPPTAEAPPSTGSATPPPDGSAATTPAVGSGSAVTPAAGSGSGSATTPTTPTVTPGRVIALQPPPSQKAWFEELADREVNEDGTFWMPKSVNKIADDSDGMFYATLALSAFFFFAIAIAVIYLVVKYRHRPGHKAEPSAAHNDALEVTWTVIPTIICVFLFYYGWSTYVRVVTPPTKAVEVQVLAWRWNWQFTHANGVQDSDLHVPVGKPIRLVMTSKDVLHSFYAPVMRVKQDIVPRRYTYAWFFPTKPGTYRLTCAEYCGTDHSQMGKTADKKDANGRILEHGRRAVLVVHKPGDYERYLSDKQALDGGDDPVDHGKRLYEKKGCTACHTIDGSPRVGPSFKGSWGSEITLAGGSKVKFDENYVRESLMAPNAKSRPGYPVGTMPAFEGQLKERDIEGIIAFLKTLK